MRNPLLEYVPLSRIVDTGTRGLPACPFTRITPRTHVNFQLFCSCGGFGCCIGCPGAGQRDQFGYGACQWVHQRARGVWLGAFLAALRGGDRHVFGCGDSQDLCGSACGGCGVMCLEKTALRAASSWLTGVVFCVGLAVAQMTDPAKVLGFLDIAGAWDAS